MIKTEKKFQKIYLTYYNLLIAQDLCQPHFQIKFRHDVKKCEACGIKCKYCNCFLEYITFEDDLIEYKCLCCDKNYQHKFDEKLKE